MFSAAVKQMKALIADDQSSWRWNVLCLNVETVSLLRPKQTDAGESLNKTHLFTEHFNFSSLFAPQRLHICISGLFHSSMLIIVFISAS